MMERYFVIQVINTDKAELRKWYRRKEGEMYIVRKNETTGRYITQGFIDDTFSQGEIEDFFCKILVEFEAKDEY